MLQHGEIVQAVGDMVAGTSGATIKASGFDAPVMDLDGNMCWRAQMENGNVTGTIDDRAVFYGRTAADMVMVLRSGDPEPTGMPGVTCNGTSSTGTSFFTGPSGNVRLSPTGGFVMFGCYLSGTGIVNTGTTLAGRNDSVIYWGFPSGQPGTLQILAQRGSPAPSGGSVYDTGFNSISFQNTGLNRQGTALFKGDLVGGDVVTGQNDDAWLIGTPGNVQWMCREGDALLGGAVVVGSIGFQAQMDENGFVLHDETLSTTLGTSPATTADDKVLLLYVGGTQVIVAREGDPMPGIAGATYGSFNLGSQCFSRTSQQMIFQTTMGGAVTTADDGCYVAGTLGNLAVVIREGDPAPTGVAGETFGTTYTSSATINENGVFCVLAGIEGPSVTSLDNVGLFYGTAGNITMIARGGMAAPDMPSGFIIGTANNSGIAQGTSSPQLNELGQVLFGVNVWDGVNASSGVVNQYAYDPVHGLRASLIGDEAWTFSGTTQNVTNHGYVQFNSGDGAALSFNSNGDYCSRVFFANGGPNVALVRNHLGSFHGSTASVPATGGIQAFELDATAANAGGLYVIGATLSGTRPGFSFGGATIPINQDVWFNLAFLAANGAVYPNLWGILDGTGRTTSAAFAFPTGFPGFGGSMFHHAFMVLNPTTLAVDFVSEPVSLHLY
ncbi:MAG: hypothetical protein KDE27_22130 [Planctomycetes bacterium]|nr:hypothetical protein [Planctomycetota bacterium]